MGDGSHAWGLALPPSRHWRDCAGPCPSSAPACWRPGQGRNGSCQYGMCVLFTHAFEVQNTWRKRSRLRPLSVPQSQGTNRKQHQEAVLRHVCWLCSRPTAWPWASGWPWTGFLSALLHPCRSDNLGHCQVVKSMFYPQKSRKGWKNHCANSRLAVSICDVHIKQVRKPDHFPIGKAN